MHNFFSASLTGWSFANPATWLAPKGVPRGFTRLTTFNKWKLTFKKPYTPAS